MRSDVMANGIKKLTKIIDKMNDAIYSEDVKKVVKITDKLSLEINGIVDELTLEINVYEIYAIKDGKEVDCMTIDYSRDLESDVKYLLNCYV